ncbi:MAG: response regulator [Desulfobulbaceae bacterium]|nr:response regulator [Desulfobulbaceae bacterium]
MLGGLRLIRESMPSVDVVLINYSDNVNASMAGMRAGASDDLTVPFDMEKLKRKVVEACHRSRKKSVVRHRRSLQKLFEDSMSAVALPRPGNLIRRSASWTHQLRKKALITAKKIRAKAARIKTQERGNSMEDIKILLVDDEENFVRTLAERLDLRDLSSDVALGGLDAIRELNGAAPDVMVLDLKMPGIDGMEVLRQVRRNYPTIQVIVQTGHGADEETAEAWKLGVFDYLKKPVDIELLAERIRTAAQVKRQIDGMKLESAF